MLIDLRHQIDCSTRRTSSCLIKALGDNIGRRRNRAGLDQIVVRRFAELSRYESVQECEAAGLACARPNAVGGFACHD